MAGRRHLVNADLIRAQRVIEVQDNVITVAFGLNVSSGVAYHGAGLIAPIIDLGGQQLVNPKWSPHTRFDTEAWFCRIQRDLQRLNRDRATRSTPIRPEASCRPIAPHGD